MTSANDTFVKSCRRPSLLFDVAVIVVVWSSLISIMLVLQTLRLEFGFQAWPLRETRNWLSFLNDGPGVLAAKLFWSWENRNALSAWWYLAARPLIQSFESAFLVLRLCTGLMVGISSYLLLVELTRNRARSFALGVGVLSSIFIATEYIDLVLWNFVGALACSLLSIWGFARFCNCGRAHSSLYAFSLVTWLVALGTYSLQCGAILAIVLISFHDRLLKAGSSAKTALIASLRAPADALPYAALFIIYVMIWFTAAGPGVPGGWIATFAIEQVVKSLLRGLWREQFIDFWSWINDGGLGVMAVIFVASAVTMFIGLRTLRAKQLLPEQSTITLSDLALVFAVGVCVVAPTVATESFFSLTYPYIGPGMRWAMVMQFWTPLLISTALASIIALLPASPEMRSTIWCAAISVAAAGAMILALAFNHKQVATSNAEKQFFAELNRVVAGDRERAKTFPHYYVVLLQQRTVYFDFNIAQRYAQLLLGRDVAFRTVLARTEPYDGSMLAIDGDGVSNVTIEGIKVPFSQVTFLKWNGRRLSPTNPDDKEAFFDFQVDLPVAARWHSSDSRIDAPHRQLH